MQMFQSMTVSPLELTLDPQNPRFITLSNPPQKTIREYLFDYEDVRGLAKDIISFGGLHPGERVIVVPENGNTVVLEGNRRVCACQILLDPKLVPANHRPVDAPAAVLDSVRRVQVDIITSRDDAAPILATRHIDTIRKWSTLAKQLFFVRRLESGQSLSEVRTITGVPEHEIERDAREYYLLKRALDLPVWTTEERSEKLNLQTLKPDRFNRIFRTKDAAKRLQITWDPATRKLQSSLPVALLDKVLELVARAAFINDKITTRSRLRDVPGLEVLLDSAEKKTQSATPAVTAVAPNDKPTARSTPVAEDSASRPSTSNEEDRQAGPSSGAISRPPYFFGGLRWGLDPKDNHAVGVITLAQEIVKISQERYLNAFPNAVAMLMRALLEQALKYHTRRIGQWDGLAKRFNGDPSLKNMIESYKKRLDRFLPGHQREFNVVFDGALKDQLDLVVHQTDLVSMTPTTLIAIADGGLRALIQILLEKDPPGLAKGCPI